ncbi:N-acetyltransferase 9 [Choanephora cucurbitarum]|uniref:N-acetyltransferase 9 n=1 Tax=Choanephora cucurbitarum TaxID=101091 RepID=A0A1C7N621_9FUNG|nr:N-acetyltransferase 9 [Choanephora cucurbitarum]
MTASEPLTLEQEYEMQQSWHQDEEKLTFIIQSLPLDSPLDLTTMSTTEIMQKTIMIGDVNIFFNDPDNDRTFGEIELMIAEPDYRKTGRGTEALKIMMTYGTIDYITIHRHILTGTIALETLDVKTFHAKVSLKNQPSIQLFQSKFKYYPISVSTVFEEMTLEWSLMTPPLETPVDEHGDPIECYGAKASPNDRAQVREVHQQLMDYWHHQVKIDSIQ